MHKERDLGILQRSSLSNFHPQFTMVAVVQRPAPAFKATAVVGGLFQDVSLADYLGQWYVRRATSFLLKR